MKRKNLWIMAYALAIIFFVLLTVGPIVWAFFISVTPEYDMFKNTKHMLPQEITWGNYRALLSGAVRQSNMLFQGLSNSLRAVGITLAIGLPAALLGAYALAKMEFRGKEWIRNGILITMVIPVFATMIPIFRMYVANGLLNNTFWLSLVYTSSFLPMSVWLISNYFSTIPKELEEAAWVDGCGRIRTFFQILLPMSYPIIFSSALIMFLSTWNQFQIPLILASSIETKPISIVTSEFMVKDSVQYGLTAAAGIIAIMPPALAALIFRKHLVSGMTHGSTKG